MSCEHLLECLLLLVLLVLLTFLNTREFSSDGFVFFRYRTGLEEGSLRGIILLDSDVRESFAVEGFRCEITDA